MIINATPHSINIYPESAFEALEQLNPTTWVADSVNEQEVLLALESMGNARIAVTTTPGKPVEGIPTVKTVYGELTGIPFVKAEDTLIVSLPTQSVAKAGNYELASQMATPYKVVRLRSNTGIVLGCMGLSFQ